MDSPDGAGDLSTGAEPTLDEERCCICLCPIEEHRSVALRQCGHVFHGQCLCDHLVHDQRCPLCRASFYCDQGRAEEEGAEEGGGEGAESEARPLRSPLRMAISFAEAHHLARLAARTDRRTANMLATIRKWRQEHREAKAEYRESERTVAELRGAMFERIAQFEEEEHARFDVEHAALLEANRALRTKKNRAGGHYRLAKMRIARRYGFQPSFTAPPTPPGGRRRRVTIVD